MRGTGRESGVGGQEWAVTSVILPRNEDPLQQLPGSRLHDHRRTVSQHLRHALSDLVRVVTHPDHRVGAELLRVLSEELERLAAGVLAKLRPESDVASDQALQSGADRSDEASGANRDSTDNSEAANDAIARKLEGSRDEGVIQHASSIWGR
jgi:hypothetical protein